MYILTIPKTVAQIHITRYAPLPPQFSDILAGVPGSILGWGADETGYLPITLQQGDVYIISNERCAELHVDGWEVFPSNICAFDEDGGTSTCGVGFVIYFLTQIFLNNNVIIIFIYKYIFL